MWIFLFTNYTAVSSLSYVACYVGLIRSKLRFCKRL